MSRSTVLWISSALVGLLCFGLAMALNQSMLRADFYALLSLEGIGYDRGMSERANRAAARPGGSPVVVLEVAETTLGDPAFRESPESFIPGLKGPLRYRKHERAYHARVVDNLRKLGAAVVVFDMVFDEPDPEVDVHFARAIKAHGKVILAAANDAGTLKDGSAERTISVQPPTETLRVAAAGMGAVVVPLDVDRTLRRFMWWSVGIHPETLEDTEIPSLGVAGAALYGGAPPDTVIAQEVKPKGTFLGRPIVGMQDADFGSLGSYIRFNGPSGSPAGAGSVAAYEEVFHVGDPSAEDPGRDERLRQQLAGKIVVIGNSSAVAQDRHRVPVFSRSRELGTTQEMPGVEVQAHMLQTALTGQYPRLAGEHLQVLLLLGCCLLTALLGRMLSPGPLVVAGLLAAVGLWVGSIQLLSHQLVFLEP
ncbi:MAG TPA: CHASE2 domain-containing protein, partial [Armatimonadota bacterium]|nr:CHASE2 domain-containing protein [Armatimonadota bacterium]